MATLPDPSKPFNNRVLVIDDDADIRKVFIAVLAAPPVREDTALTSLESLLTGGAAQDKAAADHSFSVHTADQGETGYSMVCKAKEEGKPYATVFIDMRMPPGWDGIKTAQMIRQACPLTAIVIVTAFSDASVQEIVDKVGFTDRLLYLKKPFEQEEIKQLADSLVMRWNLEYRLRHFMYILEEVLEQLVQAAFADDMEDMPYFLKGVLCRLGALIGTPDIFLAETDGKKVVRSIGLGRFDNGLGKPESINPLVGQVLAQGKNNTSFILDDYLVMTVSCRSKQSLVIGLKPGRQVEGVEEILDILARNIARVYDVAAEIVRLRKLVKG